jgi:hypothetical protein
MFFFRRRAQAAQAEQAAQAAGANSSASVKTATISLDVFNMKGETISVEVGKGSTIADVKVQIEKQNGAHVLAQMLFHGDQEDELKTTMVVEASMSPLSLILIPSEELQLSLWDACSTCYVAGVRVALDASANANWSHLDFNKRTVLQQVLRRHMATDEQSVIEIVKLLLEAGADPLKKDHLGADAFGSCTNRPVIRELLNAKAGR